MAKKGEEEEDKETKIPFGVLISRRKEGELGGPSGFFEREGKKRKKGGFAKKKRSWGKILRGFVPPAGGSLRVAAAVATEIGSGGRGGMKKSIPADAVCIHPAILQQAVFVLFSYCGNATFFATRIPPPRPPPFLSLFLDLLFFARSPDFRHFGSGLAP